MLVAGAVATTDRAAFAVGLGGFAPRRAVNAAVLRLALKEQAPASASAVVVTTPRGAAYLSGVSDGSLID